MSSSQTREWFRREADALRRMWRLLQEPPPGSGQVLLAIVTVAFVWMGWMMLVASMVRQLAMIDLGDAVPARVAGLELVPVLLLPLAGVGMLLMFPYARWLFRSLPISVWLRWATAVVYGDARVIAREHGLGEANANVSAIAERARATAVQDAAAGREPLDSEAELSPESMTDPKGLSRVPRWVAVAVSAWAAPVVLACAWGACLIAMWEGLPAERAAASAVLDQMHVPDLITGLAASLALFGSAWLVGWFCRRCALSLMEGPHIGEGTPGQGAQPDQLLAQGGERRA